MEVKIRGGNSVLDLNFSPILGKSGRRIGPVDSNTFCSGFSCCCMIGPDCWNGCSGRGKRSLDCLKGLSGCGKTWPGWKKVFAGLGG